MLPLVLLLVVEVVVVALVVVLKGPEYGCKVHLHQPGERSGDAAQESSRPSRSKDQAEGGPEEGVLQDVWLSGPSLTA